MLTLISDLPETVVGIEAHGTVTAEDYERVLVPAVEAARSASDDGKLRILYVLGPETPDYTAGAVWQDTKLGLAHLRTWERIAVVSDTDWVKHAVHGLGWAIPGEIKVFASAESGEARRWVAS